MHVAYSRDRAYKDVGTRRQLFIDDDVIAVVKNLTRRLHSPKKHSANPIIRRDKPWEGNTYFRNSCYNVIWDDAMGKFRCWYEDFFDYFGGHKETFQRSRIHYAESDDGIEWTKPALGRHVVDGYTDTNTVIDLSPDNANSCSSILLDPKETDESKRFKMLHFLRPERGLYMQYSANGFDWSPYERNPMFPDWGGDVEVLTYDPIGDKYVLFGRHGGRPGSAHPDFDGWFAPVWPGRPEGVWGTRRRVYRLESDDCLNWSDADLVFDPGAEDNLDDAFYGFVPWRADEMHLGTLTVLHHVDNTVDMYLHYSRDGKDWRRFNDHRPWLHRGGEGSLDQFDIEIATQPLVVGDELWIFYGGARVHHDWWIGLANENVDVPESRDKSISRDGHHLCLATMRLDGYVSLDATVREGWIETKPVFSTGDHLYINGRCGSDGYIKVEVMDSWNNVWDGFSRENCETFTGDSINHRVSWSAGDRVSELPGSVKLKIYLRNAEIYGFHFGGA